ncbi:sensor histidine kinase [Cohnella sp. GCM10020058]|uniref:cache domain-containing sensor histidine kinase n=1 Tax=Cohnella sp. GCM10020058 TaxID=3317330 RepID=UPI00363B3FA3
MRRVASFLHRFSLRQKMVFGFLLVSLTGVFTIALSAHYYYNRATSKDFFNLASGASASLNNQLDQYFRNLAGITYSVAAGALQQPDEGAAHAEPYLLQNWLTGHMERNSENRLLIESMLKRQITLSYSDVESLIVLSNSGEVVSSRGSGDADFYRSQWMSGAYAGDEPSIRPMEKARLSRIPVIPLAVPIYSTKNVEIAGQIILNVTTTSVRDIMSRTRIGRTGSFFIVDRSDTIVYHPDPAYIGNRIRSTALSPFADTPVDAIRKVGHTSFLTTNTQSDYTGWRVVAVVPLSEMATGLKVARNSIIIVVGFMLLFVLFVVPWLTKLLLAPVMKLNRNMREVQRGNLGVKVDVRPSRDEFQMLSNNFSHMLGTLNELIERVYGFQIREMNLELKQKDATIQALQNQINPHFLYNSLDIIKSIAFLEDVPKIEKMAGNLAAFYRYTTKLDRIEVTLRDELAHLNEYLEMVQLRFGGNFMNRNYIPEKYLDVHLVKLTLQPIVENAVKYAVEAYNGDAAILINAYGEGEDLLIEVVDNGPGIEADRLRHLQGLIARAGHPGVVSDRQEDSVGLANVQARLVMHYGAPYGLQIVSFPGRGTAVTVRIPLANRKNVQANGEM